jgi:putative hydrolase of the HAD superfamily
MIKAVIFDCFGVLTTDGWKQIREEFFADDEARYRRSQDMDKAVNAGMSSYDEFLEEISDMTELPIEEVRLRMTGSAPNKLLFDFIRDELKGTFKIGMLSNAAGNWLGEMFEQRQVELFDEVVLSYEAGTVKPDPAIYNMIIERLGVLPEEAIFIDDSERYCVAAKDLGINVIYHQDTNETIAKIKELIGA